MHGVLVGCDILWWHSPVETAQKIDESRIYDGKLGELHMRSKPTLTTVVAIVAVVITLLLVVYVQWQLYSVMREFG